MYGVHYMANVTQKKRLLKLFFLADVRPLSAPAFSFCFPLLQAILSINSGISEETELMLTHALQIIHTHSQLRSSSDATDVLIDEVKNYNTFYFLDNEMVMCNNVYIIS